jgi:thioredoxin reductase/Fe-S-cluster-containing dehydrogenase component/CRP-like cAMP-binding protein
VSERLDVAIVGGGPAGLAAGVTAALRGLSHAVFERGHLAHTIHRYQKGKHVMAEPERLPLHESLPMAFEEGSREQVLGRWQSDVERGRANLRLGPAWEVTAIEGGKGDFQLTLRGGERTRAASVVLAIGLQGNLRTFGVPGQELPHVSYQLDDPGAFEDRRIVVVGVGDAGIENALALMENGNDVAIVNRRDEFDRAKARNRALIESAIRSGQMAYYPNSVPERFEPGRIVLRGPGGETVLPADLVIGRLGAIPPRKFLDGLGVAFPSDDPAAVPRVSDAYESSVPGLFLIGAVVGYPLIKNCMNQGFEVIERLAGNAVTPADEPILREKFAGVPGSVSEIVERIRTRVPLFSKLTPIQLREFLVDSELRSLPAGRPLFERNDYSTEFYSIVEGEVEIAFPTSDADRDSDLRPGAASQRRVGFGPGAFFGEGSLISGRRRAGTATTKTAAVLVETPRSRMNALIHSSEDVRDALDSAFVARLLGDFFPGVDAAERQRLAESAVHHTFKEGELLFSEGDAPDGLHVIRRGRLAISRHFQGRDVVTNYVDTGNYLGELGLVSRARRRSATARAAAFTQTIRLPAEVMDAFLERHPAVRRQWEEREEDLRAHDVSIGAESGGETSSLLEFFMQAGGKEATDILVIDESLCVRCDNCEKACAETHHGVSRLDREGGQYFGNLHLPKACQHCEHPKCMDDCPPDALRRHPDGEVYVMENCIGCGNCISNCPYGVIQLAHVEEKARRNVLFRLLFGEGSGAAPAKHAKGEKKAVKCDLCRNLPEPRSGRKAAACVASCPTGAIRRVSPREFVEAMRARGA